MIVVKLISHSINHLYSSENILKTVKKSEMYFLSALISYPNIEYVEPSIYFNTKPCTGGGAYLVGKRL